MIHQENRLPLVMSTCQMAVCSGKLHPLVLSIQNHCKSLSQHLKIWQYVPEEENLARDSTIDDKSLVGLCHAKR